MATTQPSLSPEVLTGGVRRVSVHPRDLAAVPKFRAAMAVLPPSMTTAAACCKTRASFWFTGTTQ